MIARIIFLVVGVAAIMSGFSFFSYVTQDVCPANFWTGDCLMGWISMIDFTAVGAVGLLLSLFGGGLRKEDWDEFIGNEGHMIALLFCSVLIALPIAWYSWSATMTNFREDTLGFGARIWLYIWPALASSLWTVIMVIAIPCRLIMHRRAAHLH